MATSAKPTLEDETQRTARVQFLDGLEPRLKTLGGMLDALGTTRRSAPGERTGTDVKESLIRRLRAMRAAADAVRLPAIALEFDKCAAAVAQGNTNPTELRAYLSKIEQLGVTSRRSNSDVAPANPPPERRVTPVGPFTVVSLGSESQTVILRQALEQAEDFHLHCTQDAGEAEALLETYDPDLFVVDGKRADVVSVVQRAHGYRVMVVEARLGDVERYRDAGARWVTKVGEHYETQLLEGLRDGRRSLSMIAPRSETVVSLATLASQVADEVRNALLDTVRGQASETLLPVGEDSAIQSSVWSMLARLREAITEVSSGAVQYAPYNPAGAMIVTGKDVVRRRGRMGARRVENIAGRRILVAEHDASVGWYLVSLLRGKGAIVEEATDGLAALRAARRSAPDLVICDVLLPALDGFALCRNLKHDVALSDVPVILLSWKEDLLQRVRELGAGADGYLAKEAEEGVIVDRCSEALDPRVRIEKRLQSERVVHGRLDGVTPRTVLQLASRAVDNAKVTLHDAAFQYEVCLGDGRLLTARRRHSDGTIESGASVLPGLLGMRAGRFTVERVKDPVQAELFGSLDKLLEPFVNRARRATRRLKGAELYEVERLEIDSKALEPYIAVSPPIVNKIVAQLEQGVAPADLLHSVSAGLLESVLEDLALRGGIRRVIAPDGRDLLDIEEPINEPAFDMDFRSKHSMELLAASGAPVIGKDATADDVARAAEFAERAAEAAERAAASSRPTVRPSTRPSSGAVIVPSPTRRSDAPEADAARSSYPPGDARNTVLGLAPEAPRPERVSSLPPLPQASLTRDPRPEIVPAPDTPVPESAPPPSSLAGFTPVEAARSTRDSVGRVVLAGSPEPPAVELSDLVASLGATPGPSSVSQRFPAVRVSGSSRPPDVAVRSGRDDTLTGLGAPEEEPGPTPPDNEVETSAPPITTPSAGTPSPATSTPGTPAQKSVRRTILSVNAPSDAPPPGDEPFGLPDLDIPVRRLDPPSPEPPAVNSSHVGRPRLNVSRGLTQRIVAVGKPLAIVTGAAAGAFLGMNQLARVFATPPADQVTLQAQPGATQQSFTDPVEDLGIAPPGSTKVTRKPISTTTEMAMPEGVTLPPGKGLLEVDVGGQHKLYVGEVFVGRGPVRRMSVEPGTHKVKVELDGAQEEYEVGVVAGRRVRLQLTEPSP